MYQVPYDYILSKELSSVTGRQARKVMRVHAGEGAERKAKAVRERIGSVRSARQLAMTPE